MRKDLKNQIRGSTTKKINLALQGGGTHGAFTWGVLDRILEDERIEIDGISGTSAGGMNAAVTAYGLNSGGPQAARLKLKEFWHDIMQIETFGFLKPCWLDKIIGNGNMDHTPSYLMFDFLTKVMSPYELNPHNINPLRDVLARTIDFKKLHQSNACKLFVAATHVKSGKLKVFSNQDVTIDAVLASACLPLLFQAVEVDGEYYWDGGMVGNPPLYPLIMDTQSSDILIIQINPVSITHVPTTAREILDRLHTISFNSSLVRELRAVNFVTNLIDNKEISPDKHKRMYIHTIEADEVVKDSGVSSKLNTDHDYINFLFEGGRRLAGEFLERNFDMIGVQSSTDISGKFM